MLGVVVDVVWLCGGLYMLYVVYQMRKATKKITEIAEKWENDSGH